MIGKKERKKEEEKRNKPNHINKKPNRVKKKQLGLLGHKLVCFEPESFRRDRKRKEEEMTKISHN